MKINSNEQVNKKAITMMNADHKIVIRERVSERENEKSELTGIDDGGVALTRR